ncbi:alpha/beta fold hydrolase [Rhodocyclus tenuis]|uniref:Alpha/beta fold hydrolase n=1 Tax=Rhodocyclus gracilis TaxID=2929842 RepID=A0ABX0WN41_9RHOO|nr:alpha/beta fold hydrolase BchO [Rhodocyclus gracilis]NJA90157.1 alpha/beta fold hydrolase [Rhodocyclus gracilis]
MSDRLDWAEAGRDWPNRAASRFVSAAGMRWHVQQMGAGPLLLLVHGTGASTHSWRALAPLLAQNFSVLALDLPGHGFTGLPAHARLSLPFIANALAELLGTLGASPRVVVGHSAGAAILARMCLDRRIAPQALISLNGALLPLTGVPGHLYLPMARLFAALPLMPRFVAWRARNPALLAQLLASTGSHIDADGERCYGTLVRNAGHVAAAIGMMANWDLSVLEEDLPSLPTPLTLVVGSADRTVPPAQAERVAARLRQASVRRLPDLGHLAHEEDPQGVAALIVDVARAAGVLPPS